MTDNGVRGAPDFLRDRRGNITIEMIVAAVGFLIAVGLVTFAVSVFRSTSDTGREIVDSIYDTAGDISEQKYRQFIGKDRLGVDVEAFIRKEVWDYSDADPSPVKFLVEISETEIKTVDSREDLEYLSDTDSAFYISPGSRWHGEAVYRSNDGYLGTLRFIKQ